MAFLLRRVLHQLFQVIARLPHELITMVFIFWIIQFFGWIGMMAYVEFFNQKLGRSVLYVTQISHWALVEAAGTAALSSWALLQTKHNQSKIEELKRGEEVHTQSTSKEYR